MNTSDPTGGRSRVSRFKDETRGQAKKSTDDHVEVVGALQDPTGQAKGNGDYANKLPRLCVFVVKNLLPYRDRSAIRTHIPSQVARYSLARKEGCTSHIRAKRSAYSRWHFRPRQVF